MMLRTTLGDLKRGLDTAFREGISECAVILWADQCNDGDVFSQEGVPHGSVIFGIEEMKDGKIVRGSLCIQPKRLTNDVS